MFPLTEENPIRIELWGDEIDSIRSFDSLSQRSIENLDSIRIYPANEVLVSMEQASKAMEKIRQEGKNQEAVFRQSMRTEEAFHIKTLVGEIQEKLMDLQERKGLDNLVPYFYQKTVSFLDYLKEDAMIFLDEPNRISQEGSAVEKEFAESMENRLNKGYILPSQTELLYGCMEIIGRLNRRNCLGLCIMDVPRDEWNISGTYSMTVRSVNSYHNSFEQLVKDLQKWKKEGYRIALLSASRTRAKRLASDLQEYELNSFYSDDRDREIQPGEIMVTDGNLHHGYEYPLIRFAVLTESDIFGKEKKKRKKRHTYEGTKIQSFTDLNVGDFVVHETI